MRTFGWCIGAVLFFAFVLHTVLGHLKHTSSFTTDSTAIGMLALGALLLLVCGQPKRAKK